jgi:hypothetical protein
MRASEQVLQDEAGFDRGAAEAYLQVLGGEPAPRRRPGQAVRQQQVEPPAAPLAAPPAEQSPPAKINSWAWVAVAAVSIVIAASASLGGADPADWSASKPAAPPSQDSAAQTHIDPMAEEAYIDPKPVLMTQHPKLAKPASQHGRRPRPRVIAPHRPRVRHSDDDDIYVAPPVSYVANAIPY